MRTVLLLVVAAACTSPAEWCAQTHYFTIPDTAITDTLGIQPDSVVTEYKC